MKNYSIKTFVVGSLLVASFGANAQTSEIYRYEKDGNVFYTDKKPTNKGLEVGVLSKKTGVLKNLTDLEEARVAQEMTDEEKEQLAAAKVKEAEQMKKDQYLLNTYSSVQEINQIKQYELEQIDRAIQNDKANLTSFKDRKIQLEKALKDSPKNSSYEEELSKINSMSEKTAASLDRNKKMYTEREQKYNNEKERFTAVLNMVQKEKEAKSEKPATK